MKSTEFIVANAHDNIHQEENKKTPCCKHMQQRVSTFTVNNIKIPVFYRIILHLSLLQPTNHLSVRGQMKRKNRLLYNR